MCSWCWGYRPTAARLWAALPAEITVSYVLGGLAPDSDEPMPTQQQELIASHWHKIQALLGTEFNFSFWTGCEPRRSTYPACRAVIAAAAQHREVEMIEAIQQAYYLRAMNPSDLDTLEQLADELHLDADRFSRDARSNKTEQKLAQEIEFSRGSPINGFPSLALETTDQLVAIKLDYQDIEPTLSHIRQFL